MARISLDPHIKHIKNLTDQLKLELNVPFRDFSEHKKQKKAVSKLFDNIKEEALNAFDVDTFEPTITDLRKAFLDLKKMQGGAVIVANILANNKAANPNGINRADYQACIDDCYAAIENGGDGIEADNTGLEEAVAESDNAIADTEEKPKKKKKKKKKGKKAKAEAE